MNRQGWTYPKLWRVNREEALRIRVEYQSGEVGLRELCEKYQRGYGTIHTVVSGRHPSAKGDNLCRSQGKRPKKEEK